MPATRVPIQLDEGLSTLFCPACGTPVLVENGDVAEELCEHVRFLIDASGELSIADPESLPSGERKRQEAIIELVESTESWDDFLTQVVRVLPSSALVLELSEPATEDDEEDEGTQVVVAVDLAPSDDADDAE
jgi:uncharacterized Zn finger protein (UPF0148 family)